MNTKADSLTLIVFLAVLASCSNPENIVPHNKNLSNTSLVDSVTGAYHEYHILARDTDKNMKKIKETHYAYVDTRVVLKNKLLIFIGGTNTFPRYYQLFPAMAASMGYHIINLQYNNSVTSRVLKNVADTACFTKYREEIIYGSDLSTYVSVDTANCLMNRMIKLLKYLNKNYPADHWDQFYSGNTIDFTKCLLTGHSQGGGHAAYLAKKYEADRVICFSSPADYSELYKHPASWCSQYSATPVDRFYGLMHKRDEIIPSKEIYSIWKDMRMLQVTDTSSAERPTFVNYKALYINYPENIAAGKFKARHNMPVMDVALPAGPGADEIKQVWQYFLTE